MACCRTPIVVFGATVIAGFRTIDYTITAIRDYPRFLHASRPANRAADVVVIANLGLRISIVAVFWPVG